MAEIVEMIALSPTMEEGTLAEWYKSEGDAVEEGEIIADVETDKATMEMESWYDGTMLKIFAEAGSTVAVGDALAIVGEEGEDISDLVDQIKSGGAPASDEGDAAAEAPDEAAEDAGDDTGAEPAAEPAASEQAAPAASVETDEGRLRASPLARRIAADNNIEIARVNGTGPSGRIIKADVERFIEEGPAEPAAAASAPEVAAPSDIPAEIFQAPDVPGESIPMSQMRKTIAKRLRASWQTTPHFALTREIDMGPAMEYRSELNEGLAEAEWDGKISVNDLIVKACAQALEKYPKMNVSYQGDHVIQFDEVNIGVAVAVDDGLVTPTIKNADDKTIGTISNEARSLAEKARDKGLAPDDYGNSTFSVSNLGMFGIDHFMAVINPPEAGILACGAVEEKPVVEDGEIEVGTRMKVTLSCDHRAVDGAIGARFLAHVADLLENPVLLAI
jgi:pyruvate dehydrogenase E2 component (dihydrolipoamide acetyltransferase)